MKTGSKVECIENIDWTDVETNEIDRSCYNPKKGDILTVLGSKESKGVTFLYFKEISIIGRDGDRECYDQEFFRELVYQKFTNRVTSLLANKPIIQEGIERLIVEPNFI